MDFFNKNYVINNMMYIIIKTIEKDNVCYTASRVCISICCVHFFIGIDELSETRTIRIKLERSKNTSN